MCEISKNLIFTLESSLGVNYLLELSINITSFIVPAKLELMLSQNLQHILVVQSVGIISNCFIKKQCFADIVMKRCNSYQRKLKEMQWTRIASGVNDLNSMRRVRDTSAAFVARLKSGVKDPSIKMQNPWWDYSGHC